MDTLLVIVLALTPLAIPAVTETAAALTSSSIGARGICAPRTRFYARSDMLTLDTLCH